MPQGIMAFVASGGDVGAVITQLLCIVISFAIYTPFVLISITQSPNHRKRNTYCRSTRPAFL
jgi:cellobiose-specific phosphotransferase system component IIC